jgi:hypothetical protein
MTCIVGLAAFLFLQAQFQRTWPSTDDWVKANQAITRLDPAAIPALPPAVSQELTKRGCTIPQPFTGGDSHNVVKGRLTSATAVDWPVLCSRGQKSSIFVFPGGSATALMEFAEEADANFLQVTGLRQIGYSRALRLASPQYLHERRDPKENQPPLDYDGIEDVFIEKGSLVWYWHAGRWSHLRGAE